MATSKILIRKLSRPAPASPGSTLIATLRIVHADAGVGRNIFTFGPPPTPTPDPRPTPTPPPSLPPRPIVTPTPPGILLPSGERLAPPPRFSPAYLGWLGPQRLRIAVFRDGEEVLAVPEGATLKTSFVVRKVGVSEVVIGYVGYPENVTTKVQISR